MFESLKKKLAEYFIRKRFLDKESNEINFNNFFTNSIKILVIMPEDEIDFQSSFSVLKFLKEHKKYFYFVSQSKNKYDSRQK